MCDDIVFLMEQMACPNQLATGRGMVGAAISPLSRPAGTLVALSKFHSAALAALIHFAIPTNLGAVRAAPGVAHHAESPAW